VQDVDSPRDLFSARRSQRQVASLGVLLAGGAETLPSVNVQPGVEESEAQIARLAAQATEDQALVEERRFSAAFSDFRLRH